MIDFPTPGDLVVLTEAPEDLLEGLPREDQDAIVETIGKPIRLLGYDDERAELEFADSRGTIHFIHVNPNVIRRVETPKR